jgi:4-hydroxy-3-methylbut-2-en-1-yl diphosphate synthase IspG/GcpE
MLHKQMQPLPALPQFRVMRRFPGIDSEVGQIADADYGYVGAGRGKVSLYKKKECVERGIPEDEAVDKLIELIKSHGDWHE